jgi:predicted transcriptional regulator
VTNEQLKASVIERVLFTQDEATLQAVLKRLTEADAEIVHLTPRQLSSVEAGLADHAAGRVVTDEELERRDAAEWR